MDTIITAFLSSIGAAGFVLFIVLKYYNNVRKCLSDIISLFASTVGWFKTESTKLKIETNGTDSIKKLNQIVPELNLPDLSIQWVKPDEHGHVKLEPGKAMVLLKYDKDNTQNIINTTAAYIQKTLLINTKPFLDLGIKKAVDFAIIREFLSRTPQKDFVVTQYVESCSEDIDHFGTAFERVLSVEDEGLLTRFLLREYAVWGNKLAGRPRSEILVNESINFLNFVYNIATRGYDELTPLVYNGSTLKVAVLLVAKYDTYAGNGIKPYVQRIKEGFANGINTFYLLARNEKIGILENVYGELMSSGNYNLLNGPKVFKDNSGRDNICYCIEVRKEANMAKKYTEVKKCINEERPIECIIKNVYRDEIECDFDGLAIIINRQDITDNQKLRLKSYYIQGMTIEAIPLKIIEGGKVKASVIDTNSNPTKLFHNNYSVGSMVTCVVQEAKDQYITLLVENTNQKCIAFRRNLTPSRFIPLRTIFPVGAKFEFIIKDIDYLYNSLEVRLANFPHPWSNIRFREDEEVEIKILSIRESCIETELSEGLYAILPNSELTWFDDVDEVKRKLTKDSCIKVRIKKIDINRKIIILSLKDKVSPYYSFYSSLPPDKNVKMKIESKNTYGVIGFIELRYRVFVPASETYIGQNVFRISNGREYLVHIKTVDKRAGSLIGTFKPFIDAPLRKFKERFKEGQILSHLQLSRVSRNGAYFFIQLNRYKRIEALLLNSEISNLCFVTNVDKIFGNAFISPLIIKEINLENNIVLLSLKDLTEKNYKRIDNINYGDVYGGIILGKSKNKYCALIENVWIEVYVTSEKQYENGERIEIMKESSSVFTDAN